MSAFGWKLVYGGRGIAAGIGDLTLKITSTFSITGIATGTLIVIIDYHAVRWFAPAHR